MEGLYTHWFLGELGNNWSDVCADELETYGKVLEIPQQEEFYRSRIKISDTAVFVACDKAISELKNLVRMIVNEFGGTNILITADHGFLYTYSPLKVFTDSSQKN